MGRQLASVLPASCFGRGTGRRRSQKEAPHAAEDPELSGAEAGRKLSAPQDQKEKQLPPSTGLSQTGDALSPAGLHFLFPLRLGLAPSRPGSVRPGQAGVLLIFLATWNQPACWTQGLHPIPTKCPETDNQGAVAPKRPGQGHAQRYLLSWEAMAAGASQDQVQSEVRGGGVTDPPHPQALGFPI